MPSELFPDRHGIFSNFKLVILVFGRGQKVPESVSVHIVRQKCYVFDRELERQRVLVHYLSHTV